MPDKLQIEASNELCEYILSNNRLQKTVKRNTYATVGVGIIAAGALVALLVAPLRPPKITLLDPFGHLWTTQAPGTGQRTTQDKIHISKLLLRKVRGRTGIAPVDQENLEEWNQMLTANAARTWSELGETWGNPGHVDPGKRITITELVVAPDRVDPHTMAAEWIETHGTYGRREIEGTYRVRVLLHYTDPEKTGGQTLLDGVSLRSWEQVR